MTLRSETVNIIHRQEIRMKRTSHWDEFQWENEIRRHENSVADFFQDLVYCLDLPIGDLPSGAPGSAGAPSDPVTAGKNDAMRQWMREHDEFDDDGDYDPRRPICFSCVDALDQLAVEWNRVCIANCSPESLPVALGIACAFAKLLARAADFTEPDRSCGKPLQITLGKRALADLADLVQRLDAFQQAAAPDEEEIFSYFRLRLGLVRDQLIGKLEELRSAS